MSQSSKQQLDQHLMDHFEDPYHRGVCELATHEASGRNPLCHDVLQITLRLDSDDGSIEEAWFSGEGCVVCEAAASMLMEKVEGMDRSAWRRWTASGDARDARAFRACRSAKMWLASLARSSNGDQQSTERVR
ncbi:MAG: iron-sulfur cluster assembly scaffold protein [Pirellulaceae bacterium]